jgi:hypothetical protein
MPGRAHVERARGQQEDEKLVKALVDKKLDEATLQQIAQIGNGKYFRATVDGSELGALVSELNTLQKGELSSQIETCRIDRFQGFLAAALIALVVMELIPDRVRGRVAKRRAAVGGQALSTASGQ